MQINAQLDDELSALDAQKLAERLAAKPAMGECVALATRLPHA
jgi:anti-sigma factor RsiW